MNPETAAGRALLDRLALPWTPDMAPGYEGMVEGWRPGIAAIEAEACATVLADAIQRVEAERDQSPHGVNAPGLARAAAILRDLGDGAG